MTNKCYVANISFRATEEDIKELFKECGTVQHVRLVQGDRGHRGFGFVEMATAEEAKNAIDELNGVELLERPLAVDFAREKPRGEGPRRDNRPSGGYSPSPSGDRRYSSGGGRY